MKKVKHMLAVVCASALIAGVVPASAFGMEFDFSGLNAQWQANLDAQLQAQQQMQAQSQEWLESFFFDVEAAYRQMMSYKTPAEKEKYFFSLNIYQRAKLVEYLQYKASIGEFTGFDEPDKALEAQIKAENEGKNSLTSLEREALEEQEFAAYYANEIELYRQFGDFADLSNVGYDVQVKIKSYVADEKAGTTAADRLAEENARALEAAKDIIPSESSSDVQDEESSSVDEEAFYKDYAHYINLYREFGEYADLSGVPQDVQQLIRSYVDDEKARAAEEEASAEVAAKAEKTDKEESDPDKTTDAAPAEAGKSETTDTAVDAQVTTPEAAPEAPALTEEQMFYNDYEHYINLYREFGPYADLSGVPYDVQQRIKALVDGEKEEASPAEEAEDKTEEDQTQKDDAASATDKEDSSDASVATETTQTSSMLGAPAPVLPDAAPITVSLNSTRTDVIAINEPVTLTGVLQNVENHTDIQYVWEVDKNDGNGYVKIEDAPDSDTYTYLATKESLSWDWRLTVLYK